MTNTVNEIRLSYLPNKDYLEKFTIKSSADAYSLARSLFDDNLIYLREEMVVIYLNRANRVLGYFKAFTGGSSSVVVDIKLILAVAVKGMASGIVLAHNHPSGNRKPSEQDRALTKRMKVACESLELNLTDHLIITPEQGYFSFADEGLL